MLLTVPDMPPGWSRMDVASAQADGPNTAMNICGEPGGGIDWTENAEATGKVAFSAGRVRLVQQVSRLGTSGARTALAELAAAAQSCEHYTRRGVTVTITELTGLPEVGDQMVALRAKIQGPVGLTIDMVAWRHGPIADGIAYFDFGGNGSKKELIAILKAADAKFSS